MDLLDAVMSLLTDRLTRCFAAHPGLTRSTQSPETRQLTIKRHINTPIKEKRQNRGFRAEKKTCGSYQIDVFKDFSGTVHLSQDNDHFVAYELFKLPQVTHHLHF